MKSSQLRSDASRPNEADSVMSTLSLAINMPTPVEPTSKADSNQLRVRVYLDVDLKSDTDSHLELDPSQHQKIDRIHFSRFKHSLPNLRQRLLNPQLARDECSVIIVVLMTRKRNSSSLHPFDPEIEKTLNRIKKSKNMRVGHSNDSFSSTPEIENFEIKPDFLDNPL
ncbi:hypothetical protein CR513_06688, partial [Mucuna pruriens]